MAKLCIAFAGVVGSSKTPTALYLSQQLAWPVFSNDAIRVEVLENTLQNTLDIQAYTGLRDKRLQAMLERGSHFIFDASIDRGYKDFNNLLRKYDYKILVISFDLSEQMLQKLYTAKHYFATQPRIPLLLSDHTAFSKHYKGETITITDDTFKNRLQVALTAAQNWVGAQS